MGQTKLYVPAHNEAKPSLHNQFIVKSLRGTEKQVPWGNESPLHGPP